MKILVGSGNFTGSNLMVSRWLQNMPQHQFKVVAWYKNHRYLDVIDWCLDGLHDTKVGELNYFVDKFGIQGPYVNYRLTDSIIDDLLLWEPDLVISDCETFTAALAKIIQIPLWYCSGMLQMIGIEHDRKEINTKKLDRIKTYLESLPEGDEYLVYSPLCDVSCRPFLKTGFDWVRPFSTVPQEVTTEDVDLSLIQRAIPDRALLTTGETSLVSDCMYSGRCTFISPSPDDPEQVLNAQLMGWYGVARNIGRPKSLEFVKQQVESYNSPPILSIQKWRQLDERLERYERKRSNQRP